MNTDNQRILEEKLNLIAGLKSSPGYIALCEIFEDESLATLNNLSICKDPREAMRLLRYWQVISRISQILVDTPEKVTEEMAKIRGEQSQLEDNYFLPPEMNPRAPQFAPVQPPPRGPRPLRPVPIR